MSIPRLFACILGLTHVIGTFPVKAQWQKLPPMSEPKSGFACGVDGNDIIVIGGTHWQDGTKRWLQTISRFDTIAMRWEIVGKLIEPSSYAVCDVRRDDGALVILGGSNGKVPVQAIAVVNKNTASTMPAPSLPPEVVLSAGAIIGDEFIVIGGTNDAANIAGFTNHAFSWNLKSKSLTTLPNYPGPPFAMAAAAVLGGELFVFGGGIRVEPNNGIANTAEAYALSHATKQWRKLKPYPVASRGPAAVALDEHRIYIAGGYGGTPEGFLAAGYIYDERTNSYAPATPIPYAATAALIKLDGFVYCLGGEDNPKSRSDAIWRIRVEDLVR